MNSKVNYVIIKPVRTCGRVLPRRSVMVMVCLFSRQETDESLASLDQWPTDGTEDDQMKSKSTFQIVLRGHREDVNSASVTYRSEMTYYSNVIAEMMNWSVWFH